MLKLLKNSILICLFLIPINVMAKGFFPTPSPSFFSIKHKKIWIAQNSKKKSLSEKKEYTLKELLKFAWMRNPMIKEAMHKLEAMKIRRQEVTWLSWWPQGTLVALIAPSPPARGDATHTSTPIPSSYGDFSSYGVLTRFELSLAFPLYTFGKLGALDKAAQKGIRLAEANVRLSKSKISLLVKKVYYGVQKAESALMLLEDAGDYLDQARKKVKSKTDRLKLAVIEAELKARKVQAHMGKRLALSALAKLTGLSAVQLSEPELEEPSISVKKLQYYQKIARQYRPELQILRQALAAKKYLLTAQKRLWTPDLFIGAFIRHAYSNVADDQKNPFVRDDFNYLEGGIGLGLRFSLDFPLKIARARRAAANFAAFKSRYQLAQLAIKMDVERRFREFKANQQLLKIRKAGRKAANQWITRALIGYSSGLVELKELTDALMAAAKGRFDYIEALYQFNLSIAQLSRAIGKNINSKDD